MKIRQLLDRQVSSLVAAVGLLVGVAMPALFPVVAMAANPITARSITMSSSAKGATNVSYQLQFTASTAVSAGGGVVIDFCNDTPIVGLTCDNSTIPNPVDASAATLGTVKYNGTDAATAGSITKTATNIKWTAGTGYAAGDVVQITFNGITNPATAHAFYARIVTYKTSLAGYTGPNTLGTYDDEGGIALATTESIDVTAYVAETLTFCVSGGPTAPTSGCVGVTDPGIQLGVDQGNGVKVLTTSLVSTGTDYAQLSTNASGGAVVNLHSSALSCGGLVRNGPANCDIVAQNTIGGDIAAADAKFGLKVGPVSNTTDAVDTTGTLTTATTNYDNSKFYIDYDATNTNATGVTSTYGSKLFTTNGGPASNKNMPITFGASTANSTPAGIYKASLNLIATGTF